MSRRLPALLLTATLALTACSGEIQGPEPSFRASADPAVAEALETLDAMPAVDLRALELPESPGGVDPAVWAANATWAKDLLVASFDDRWWTLEPEQDHVGRVASVLPSEVRQNVLQNVVLDTDLPTSQLFVNHFAPEAQPQSEGRIVSATWDTATIDGGIERHLPQLFVTGFYQLGDGFSPVLVTRSFAIASDRATEPIGGFNYFFSDDVVGHDACLYYTDGVIAPGNVDPAELTDAVATLEDDPVQLASVLDQLNKPLEERRAEACDG